jgi:hypothetical protein
LNARRHSAEGHKISISKGIFRHKEYARKQCIRIGGGVPLAYRVGNLALQIVDERAGLVRDLFQRYFEIGSAVRLEALLTSPPFVHPRPIREME